MGLHRFSKLPLWASLAAVLFAAHRPRGVLEQTAMVTEAIEMIERERAGRAHIAIGSPVRTSSSDSRAY